MKRQALWLGAFILGALALAAGLVIWLSGSDVFRTQAHAVVYFQGGVAGLVKGAPVTFRGVPVGEVESIGLQVDPKSLFMRIPVNVRLSPKVVTLRGGGVPDSESPNIAFLVGRGLRATLVSQSLVTGLKSVELNMFPDAVATPAEKGERPEIPVVLGRLDSLLDQLADVPVRATVEDVRRTMVALQTALGDTHDTLVAARAALQTTSREVVALSTQARSTLQVASRAVVRVQDSSVLAINSVTRLADSANRTVDVAGPELLRTIGSAREAADAARVAMARLSDISAPDAPLRADLEGAVADLSQAARSLREWSELLERQPNALVFGRGRP